MEMATTISPLFTAIVAIASVVATWYAIVSYRDYHKEILQKNTMDLLAKLESDPVINESLMYLHREGKENGGDYGLAKDKIKLEFHASKLVNYLEDISYRVEHKTADKKAVENQFKEIIKLYVRVFILGEEYLKRKCSRKLELAKYPKITLPCLMKLYSEWENEKFPADPS